MKYYKILPENMKTRGFQYKEGINTDIHKFNPSSECEHGGLYFTDIDNILYFLNYGECLWEVIPCGEIYHKERKSKAHSIIIENKRKLSEVSTWEYLIDQGVNITADNNYAVLWACCNGYLKVVKYLVENGADITADDNFAICLASDNGHLDIVMYLKENGVDITARYNYAVRWACCNGHLEIVKYLVSKGADVTDHYNVAIIWASENGHLEIVEYLKTLYENKEDKIV